MLIFAVSVVFLVKGADWLLESAENIGLAFGLSPFIVGVVIVGLGTSFPELVSSLAAVLKNASEIVVANAVGSNIANILLVVGISAVAGKRLTVTKNLIDLDLPLLAISTALFLGAAWDRQITFAESILLLSLFVIYLLYTMFYGDKEDDKNEASEGKRAKSKPKITRRDVAFLAIGVAGLVLGAKYLIDSVIKLSEIWNIGTGVIALAGVALGTSLPELIVSVKAARQGKPEVALGNIFGSNVFNIVLVIGLPGLFGTLVLDEKTFALGVPVMLAATALFVISGISKRIHIYEGMMYLVIYVFFIGKLFGLI